MDAMSIFSGVCVRRGSGKDRQAVLNWEIFLNQKQTARATTLLRRIIKTNPENTKAHFNLGIAYRRLGNPERALEHLEKVIILEPENSEACSLLRTLKDQI